MKDYNFFLFPCNANKKPATKHGFKDATNDPIEKKKIIETAVLIGIACKASNLVAIDVDIKGEGKNGYEELQRLCEDHDIAHPNNWETWTQATPSKGRHYLLQVPKDATINQMVLKNLKYENLDIRYQGYICTGKGYTITNDVEPVQCPLNLLEVLITSPSKKKSTIVPTTSVLQEKSSFSSPQLHSSDRIFRKEYIEKAIASKANEMRQTSSNRNATLNRLTYTLAGQFLHEAANTPDNNKTEIESQIRNAMYNAALDCQAAGWKETEQEIMKTIESAIKGGRLKLYIPPSTTNVQNNASNERSERVGNNTIPVNPKVTFTFEHGEEIEDEPIDYVIESKLPAGIVAILAGAGGVGKSIFATELAFCVANGIEPFTGLPMSARNSKEGKQKTLYYSFEDEKVFFRKRLYHIRKKYKGRIATGNDDELRYTTPAIIEGIVDKDSKITQTYEELKISIIKEKPRLIVIDTLSKIYSGNENDNQAASKFITALQRIIKEVEKKPTILLIHHLSKEGKTRGASAFVDESRLTMRMREVDDFVIINSDKNNYCNKHSWDMAFYKDPDNGRQSIRDYGRVRELEKQKDKHKGMKDYYYKEGKSYKNTSKVDLKEDIDALSKSIKDGTDIQNNDDPKKSHTEIAKEEELPDMCEIPETDC